ncbi:MAG: HAD family hydrolase [Candidatus Moranbacteria bacterium]|nr:HAD family hydrolase [Candidatus Moranbacteria bacterium]
MKNIIFDFDGVLGDSYDACHYASCILDNLTPEDCHRSLQRYFSTPHFSRSRTFTPEYLSERQEWMREFEKHQIEKGFSLFDGFINEVSTISDARFSIVTSGSKGYITPLLKPVSLSFSHILDFFDHHSKETKVEMICQDWRICPKEVYYVTDTQSDVLELREIMDPAKIIGCAWGYQGYDALQEVLPSRQIMQDFSDVHMMIT